MGIDPAPFWANLFIYHFEGKYFTFLVSARCEIPYNFHSIRIFIDDTFVLSMIETLSSKILRIDLNLDIKIKDGVFVYKLFDKRDASSFKIVRMPFIDSTIPSNTFYSAIFTEILRIIRSTFKFEHLKPRL